MSNACPSLLLAVDFYAWLGLAILFGLGLLALLGENARLRHRIRVLTIMKEARDE